jgi:hypothetical protein
MPRFLLHGISMIACTVVSASDTLSYPVEFDIFSVSDEDDFSSLIYYSLGVHSTQGIGDVYSFPVLDLEVMVTGGCISEIKCPGNSDFTESSDCYRIIGDSFERDAEFATPRIFSEAVQSTCGRIAVIESKVFNEQVELKIIASSYKTNSSRRERYTIFDSSELNCLAMGFKPFRFYRYGTREIISYGYLTIIDFTATGIPANYGNPETACLRKITNLFQILDKKTIKNHLLNNKA